MNMSSIKKFEEIKAWQKARKLTNDIYQICNRNAFNNELTLRNQLNNLKNFII